ncbi:MAG TPA: ABC transporter substrate-binding protein [Bacteroidia bacterium]|jgi:oligopeptide transport system substrate-binding protein|nr:ABC transporter substrate-binding protein [Bacteroidia bacterium]
MKIISKYSFILALSVFFAACGHKDTENSQRPEGSGGYIRIAEVTPPKSIFPQAITNLIEGMVAGQIHEGLVRLNPKTLEPVPGLAEKWEVSPDGKTITFHLRQGCYFQNAEDPESGKKGSEITSKDVKFTFELLSTDRLTNMHFATVCKDRIVGANEYFDASSKGQKTELKGFKVIDKYTFSISLNNASGIFLQILANPVTSIISEDAYKLQYENLKVGAGPFIYSVKYSNPKKILLTRNPNYYGKDEKGNSLPYLDSVVINILNSTEEGLQAFKEGKCEYIGSIPSNAVRTIVEENIKDFENNPPAFILERSSEMISQYYVFNINKTPFDNVKVRQAFSYAIDRDKIIDKVLQGQAYGPGSYGITPPTFEAYKVSDIIGYNFDPEKAKKLLMQAGYPGGVGFPEVSLLVNSGNTRNNTVAAEIQRQLKENLNVNITFESLTNGEKYKLQNKGMGNIFRDGWVADYPSPESFLSVFYGEPVPADTAKVSYPNTQRYMSKEFDKYYKMGRDARQKDSSYAYFMKAEQILMNDAPLMVLWYESNYRLISSKLKNFVVNPLRYFDLTRVMIGTPEPTEKKK